jgi:hypothetical protein
MLNNLKTLKEIIDRADENMKMIYDRELHDFDSNRDKRIMSASIDNYNELIGLLKKWCIAEVHGVNVQFDYMLNELKEV